MNPVELRIAGSVVGGINVEDDISGLDITVGGWGRVARVQYDKAKGVLFVELVTRQEARRALMTLHSRFNGSDGYMT